MRGEAKWFSAGNKLGLKTNVAEDVEVIGEGTDYVEEDIVVVAQDRLAPLNKHSEESVEEGAIMDGNDVEVEETEAAAKDEF